MFIFKLAFLLGGVARSADHAGRDTPNGQNQYHMISLAPQQDGTKQGQRCSHAIWPLMAPGPLARRCSRHGVPGHSFLGYSGHMAQPTFVRSEYAFSDLRISQLSILLRRVAP